MHSHKAPVLFTGTARELHTEAREKIAMRRRIACSASGTEIAFVHTDGDDTRVIMRRPSHPDRIVWSSNEALPEEKVNDIHIVQTHHASVLIYVEVVALTVENETYFEYLLVWAGERNQTRRFEYLDEITSIGPTPVYLGWEKHPELEGDTQSVITDGTYSQDVPEDVTPLHLYPVEGGGRVTVTYLSKKFWWFTDLRSGEVTKLRDLYLLSPRKATEVVAWQARGHLSVAERAFDETLVENVPTEGRIEHISVSPNGQNTLIIMRDAYIGYEQEHHIPRAYVFLNGKLIARGHLSPNALKVTWQHSLPVILTKCWPATNHNTIRDAVITVRGMHLLGHGLAAREALINAQSELSAIVVDHDGESWIENANGMIIARAPYIWNVRHDSRTTPTVAWTYIDETLINNASIPETAIRLGAA